MIQAIICAALINALVLYHEPGLGAFFALAALLLLFVWRARQDGTLDRTFQGKAVFLMMLGLVFVLRDMLVFKVLLLLALPFLWALLLVELRGDVRHSLRTWAFVAFRPLAGPVELIQEGTKRLFAGRSQLRQRALGLLLSAAFLAFVVPLLLSSDLVAAALTRDLFEHIALTPQVAFRMAFFLFLAGYLYSQTGRSPAVWSAAAKTLSPNQSEAEAQKKNPAERETVIVTLLAVVNAVYVLFVYVQIRYLFLGGPASLPEGIGYAEYARSGFFQLLQVALLNVALVVAVQWLTKERPMIRIRILSVATLVMTQVMALSAFWRMHLYEASYGYTRMRMLVFMFLVFLMGFILLLALRILVRAAHHRNVSRMLAAYVLGAYLLSSLFNVDGFVAARNIERFEATGKIHLSYLLTLSDDARREVHELLRAHPELVEAQGMTESVDDWHARLDPDRQGAWQSWNLATDLAQSARHDS